MDYASIPAEQLQSLVGEIIETRGDALSRIQFTDALLLLLEDVPGLEAVDHTEAIVGEAWLMYTVDRPMTLPAADADVDATSR